jgi:hypothetical protein
VVIYRRFGTIHQFHLQASRSTRTVNIHWVTFQNNKHFSSGTHCTGSLVGFVAGANGCAKFCFHQDSIPELYSTYRVAILSFPGPCFYRRRINYEFGALHKQIFILEGGRRTRVLPSGLAPLICSPRYCESSENLIIVTSSKSKSSTDAQNSDVILVPLTGCLYTRCRIDCIPFN